MNHGGMVDPSGDLFLKVIRNAWPEADYPEDPSHRQIAHWTLPHTGLTDTTNEWRVANFRHFARGWRKLAVMRAAHRYTEMPFMYGALWLRAFRGDGTIDELGLASLRVVTTAGVTDVCTRFAGTSAASIANYKYHGFGTGGTAEASGDTALVTELTTQYAVDSTRPTGSQVASTNTYTSVATLSPDSGGTIAITEHGLFSATSSVTLLDRSLFSAVNLVAGSDSLQATYVLTLPAGS